MRNKALGPEVNDAARSYIRDIVEKEFKGNASKASKEFRISQSMLYEFLDGSRGAGMKLLRGVAAYKGVAIDVVLGQSPPVDPLGGRPIPPELTRVLAHTDYLPETKAQLGLYASFTFDHLPESEWKTLGDGYERENQAARVRARVLKQEEELRRMRPRTLPMSPSGGGPTTKRRKS